MRCQTQSHSLMQSGCSHTPSVARSRRPLSAGLVHAFHPRFGLLKAAPCRLNRAVSRPESSRTAQAAMQGTAERVLERMQNSSLPAANGTGDYSDASWSQADTASHAAAVWRTNNGRTAGDPAQQSRHGTAAGAATEHSSRALPGAASSSDRSGSDGGAAVPAAASALPAALAHDWAAVPSDNAVTARSSDTNIAAPRSQEWWVSL